MSDTTKPVEETPVTAPAATEPVESVPAADAAPTEETPAATTEPASDVPAPVKEEPVSAEEKTKDKLSTKKDTEVEATPASEGVLGYKAPGLVKQFRFSKKFFWFSDDALEHKHLNHFVQNEKAEVAHPIAAWSQQTGKGLLFFAKRAEDKSSPVGIINLAEIGEVTKDGFNDFFFKLGGHKHTFQAGSSNERASWIVALQSKATEAKSLKEGIVGSDGYKSALDKYTKPVAVAAPIAAATKPTESTPKKSTEDKLKDVVKKEKAESTNSASSEEKKRKDKSRSQSRKRGSIFGTLLGKKEEHDQKKEVKKETKAEEKAEKEEAKEEPKAEPEAPTEPPAAIAEPAAVEAAPVEAVAAAAVVEEKKPEETTEKTEAKAAEPKTHKSKRGSVFGNFFQKVTSPTSEKTEKEVAPAVPAKDSETPAVADTAPQIETPVESGKPIEAESVTKPIDTPTPATETTTTHETGTSPSKGGLIGFWKKAEEKLEGKKETKPEEKKVEEPAAAPVAAEEAAPAVTTETTTPTPAAASAPVKEKRRTSLFGSLGTISKRKDKTEKDASDAENTDGETKHKAVPTSPLPKLGGLFRKPSKAVKTEKETTPAETEASADKPEPISKDEPSETAAPATNGEGPKESIGDVVPEAVNIGHTGTPVQAAA